MRRRLMRGGLALLLAGAAACSYIVDLPAGAGVIPGGEGGVPSGFDAGPLADGGTPKPIVPFCASRTEPSVFCADFDGEPAPALDTIGTTRVSPGATTQIVTSVALSPARAALATASAASASAAVVRTLAASPNGVTYSFDLLVSAWGQSAADVTPIELVDGTTRCVIRLTGEGTKWLLNQACTVAGVETAVSSDSGRFIERGFWHRFAIAIRFAPAKTVTLDMDGVRVVDVPALDPMTPATPSIWVGLERLRSGTVAIFEDNVLVTSP